MKRIILSVITLTLLTCNLQADKIDINEAYRIKNDLEKVVNNVEKFTLDTSTKEIKLHVIADSNFKKEELNKTLFNKTCDIKQLKSYKNFKITYIFYKNNKKDNVVFKKTIKVKDCK